MNSRQLTRARRRCADARWLVQTALLYVDRLPPRDQRPARDSVLVLGRALAKCAGLLGGVPYAAPDLRLGGGYRDGLHRAAFPALAAARAVARDGDRPRNQRAIGRRLAARIARTLMRLRQFGQPRTERLTLRVQQFELEVAL